MKWTPFSFGALLAFAGLLQLRCSGAPSTIHESGETSWASSRDHDTDLDLRIPLSSAGTTSEPRQGGVQRLVVTFTNDMDPTSFSASDVTILGRDINQSYISSLPTVTSLTYDSATKTATLSLSSGLPDVGYYRVRLGAVRYLDTGEPMAEQSREILFYVIQGDCNGNLTVEAASPDTDLDLVIARFGAAINSSSNLSDIRVDVTTASEIDVGDIGQVSSKDGNTVVGILPP